MSRRFEHTLPKSAEVLKRVEQLQATGDDYTSLEKELIGKRLRGGLTPAEWVTLRAIDIIKQTKRFSDSP